MIRGLASVLLGVGLGCVLGCGGSDGSGFQDPNQQPAAGLPPPGSFNTGDPAKQTPTTDCAPNAKLAYVLSQERDLYSFAPDTLTFKKIGHLGCNATGAPVSMAIDRKGWAWVNYEDGSLQKVSTDDASCTATGFVPKQQGFAKFGMAFSTNGPSTTDETLFISGLQDGNAIVGKGLGKIDVASLKLTMLGDYSDGLATKAAELTGTGDGRLFGFFTTSPATLAQIDQLKGATSSDKALTGVNAGNAFAFTFWGGDFWFYTTDGHTPSIVTQLKTGDGSLTVVKKDVGGFRIVGAGVSTCAPTAMPK